MKTRTSLLVVPWFVILVWALIAQPARTTDFLLFMAMFAGMAAIAILVMRRTGRGGAASHDPFGHQAQGTDVINVSHIRVAGFGGLGLVAVAAGMAIALPRIGQTLIIGAIGGAAAAFAVIRYRRTHGGPLDSSHMQPGGRAMLVEPEQPESADRSVSDVFGPHSRARIPAR